ncbi:MAG: hypothetical protein WCR66_00175 [Bacteroidota bacterium]
MKVLSKNITHFIIIIVALQLLNLSIYAQDFTPLYSNQATTETNISETVVEYIVEVIMGHTNAFPEQSQHHKDLHFHKHIDYKVINSFIKSNSTKAALICSKNNYQLMDYSSVPIGYVADINPPPPKGKI